MYFKLEHLLNELTLGFKNNEPISFALVDDENASVTLRPPTAEEKEKYKGSSGLIVCTAFTEKQPSPEICEIFERLGNNLMPESFKKQRSDSETETDQYKYIDEEGHIEDNHVPPAKLFSEQFQEFESKLLHQLTECIQRTAKIIRWRNAINSSHKPTKFTRGLSWSFDGEHWRGVPQGLSLGRIMFQFYWPVSDEAQDQIASFLKSDVNEPLGHELFLEAWELLHRNPRSALIIGMAAAEVGFKQCVGRLVPQAEWLANNVPSPPLKKMLSEYLPLLPVKFSFQGKVVKPPQRIRTAIGRGTEARNHTVHVGAAPPDTDQLKEILLSIRDLLCLLDVYCGFKWAFDNVRSEVREEMAKEFGLPDLKGGIRDESKMGVLL